MPARRLPGAARDAAVRAAACALAALGIVIAAAVSVGVVRFVGSPWAGIGMLPDGSVAPLALSPDRVRSQAGALRFEDRLVAVDGVPVDGAAGVHAAVERAGPGAPLRYTVERGGQRIDATIVTTTFTAGDYTELFLPLLLGGFLGLALGLLPVLVRPDSTPARLFFLGNLG